jgi:hypothetical protein
MNRTINRKGLLKLAVEGPVSKQFELLIGKKVVGELFNQKRDLFYQNFLAALYRLDNNEIDEVKYYFKGQDNVSFIKLNEYEYEIKCSIIDEHINKKIKRILTSN